MTDPKADVLGHVLDKTFPELPGDIAPSTRAQLVLARLSEAGYVLDVARASRPEPTRWHGNLVCPGAEVCTEQDEDGAHAYADPHSPDWYDGYAEGQHDAASRPEPKDKQPHDRLADAEAAMFSRLADAASRPEPGADLAELLDLGLSEAFHDLGWCKWSDPGHAVAHDEDDEDGYRRDLAGALADYLAARGVPVSLDLAGLRETLEKRRYQHANIEMPDPATGQPMRGCAWDRQAWPCEAVAIIDSVLAFLPASPEPKEPTDD